jgi:hypothetical protein
MSDWGVTTKVPAEVVLAEGIVVSGELHLYARPNYPPGPETPLEMLNRSETFLALTLPDGVAFLAKAQVVVVTCPNQNPLADPDRVSAARLVGLEVVVHGGHEYQGSAALELPPSRGRTLDYLNGTGVFFQLDTGDMSRYINKSLVRFARPLD